MNRLNKIAKKLVEEKTKDNIELFKVLDDFDKFCLNKFYNMNFEIVETYSDETILFEASKNDYAEVVEYLIGKGININIQDKDKWSPLLIASINNSLEVIKLLLQQPNIDVNLRNSHLSTALIIASKYGHINVVELLLQHENIDVYIKDDVFKIALQYAKTDKIEQLLIKYGR